ncbi:hypothetical protein WL1483_4016 [Aeromonas schubertii]|uniref:Uncharacterized protein n=1 Tax=Aeromonas schubertii TaxID=652 RepID=A0A0S2SNZ8_9GAMM|nr:hypothetical protein WL1483_4016 [Aeromonas schubertii]
MLVEARDHGGGQYPDRNAGAGELLDDPEAPLARGCAWLESLAQGLVEGGDRNHDAAQSFGGELGQYVPVAQHHGALGDQGYRMAVIAHDLQ